MKTSPIARRVKTFAASWAFLAVVATLWALATPIGAAPDEPAHLIKAASVVRGEFIGERVPGGNMVRVPEYIAFSFDQTCYAFHPDVSADCMKAVPGDTDRTVDARTTAGLYNPLYYALIGWPSLLFGDSSGILAMRIVSAILETLFFAISFALISSWHRATIPLVGFAVAVTPMTLFLAGTVNPNSLEISATVAAFVGLWTVLRSASSNAMPLHLSIVFVAASIAANMRGLSLLWLALALGTPLLASKRDALRSLWRQRGTRLAVAGIVITAAAAAAWVISTNSLGAATSEPGAVSNVPGAGSSPWSGFVWTLSSTFEYAKGIVGVFGWLDTPAPDFVYFCWAALAGGLLIVCATVLRGRAALPTLALGSGVLLLPAILQAYYIHAGGIIWQGRYILPLFVCLTVAAGIALSEVVPVNRRLSMRIFASVLALWGLAQFASFATALKRYAVGADADWAALLHPNWVPPLGIGVLLGCFAALIALGIVAFLLWWRADRGGLATPEPLDENYADVTRQ
ncbi:MAG: DUF2142 domain-containing protein [Candidatus Saccharibacteria bacterium]|nr:DUF2142 domain-containing protein [Microbacteriaceae bacterium]